jgi:hypothetical protein
MSTTPPTTRTRQEASVALPEALPAFPIGTRVWLKFSSDTRETGTVTGYTRGKLIVHWPDWNREGRYHECSLLKVEDRP